MSVDEALKYVISMGVVAPPTRIDPAAPWRCEICRAERPARAQPDAADRRQPKRLAQRRRATAAGDPDKNAWSDAMRTTYCGLVSEALLGQTITLMGWAHRRRDHGGVIFIDLRDREGLVQIVCDPDRAATFADRRGGAQRVLPEGHRPGARAPRRHRQRQPDERQGRGAVPRARGAEPERDAAVPARRGEPLGDDAPDAPRARPAPAADAEEPDAALPRWRWRCASSSTTTASSTSRRRCSPRARPRARATTSCPAASTTACSSRCRRARSCSSSC